MWTVLYIGETMQPLYMRFNQHKGDIRHHDKLKPLSEHVNIHTYALNFIRIYLHHVYKYICMIICKLHKYINTVIHIHNYTQIYTLLDLFNIQNAKTSFIIS